MLMFGLVGMSAFLGSPTRSLVGAGILGTVGITLGACRDDEMMVGVFLLYCGTLAMLGNWSRRKAQAGVGYVVKQERESRYAAEEISNWARKDDPAGEVRVEEQEQQQQQQQQYVVVVTADGEEPAVTKQRHTN